MKTFEPLADRVSFDWRLL